MRLAPRLKGRLRARRDRGERRGLPGGDIHESASNRAERFRGARRCSGGTELAGIGKLLFPLDMAVAVGKVGRGSCCIALRWARSSRLDGVFLRMRSRGLWGCGIKRDEGEGWCPPIPDVRFLGVAISKSGAVAMWLRPLELASMSTYPSTTAMTSDFVFLFLPYRKTSSLPRRLGRLLALTEAVGFPTGESMALRGASSLESSQRWRSYDRHPTFGVEFCQRTPSSQE